MKRTVLALVLALAAVGLLVSGCGDDEPEDLIAAFQIADMQDTFQGERLLRLCQAYEAMLDVNSESIVLDAAVDIVNEQRVEPLRPDAVDWLHELLRSCVG